MLVLRSGLVLVVLLGMLVCGFEVLGVYGIALYTFFGAALTPQ